MAETILKKVIKRGSELWNSKVDKVAKMLDDEEKFRWEIGDEAAEIKPRKINGSGITELQQFAYDIAEKMGKEDFKEDVYRIIIQYRYVSNAGFPKILRNILSWSHHYLVVKLNKDEAIKQLKNAAKYKWSYKIFKEELIKKKLIVPKPQVWYHQWTKGLIRINTSVDHLLEQDWDAIYTKQDINTIATDCFMLVSTTLPKIVEKAIEHGAKVKPEFQAYVKKFVR